MCEDGHVVAAPFEFLGKQRNDEFEAFIHRFVVGVRWLVAGLVGLICAVTAAGVVNTRPLAEILSLRPG